MNGAETPRKATTILDWRNWPLVVKFGAVALVPVIFAVTLGISQIQWQVNRADQFHRVSSVLDAVDEIEPLVNDIQAERTTAVEVILGSKSQDQLAERANTTDATAGVVEDVLSKRPAVRDEVINARYDDVQRALDQLDALRQGTRAGQVDPPTVIGSYSQMINAILALDRALISTIDERSLSSSATAMQAMLALMEEVRLQQAWVHTGLSEGELSPQVLQVMVGSRARLTAKVQETGAIVAPHWRDRLDRTMAGEGVTQRNQLLDQLVAATTIPSADSADIAPDQWNDAGNEVIALIDDGHNDLSAEVRQGATQLEEEASDAAGRDSVFLISALLIAGATVVMIARQLLGSLRELRRSALHSAQEELPEAVASIRAGEEANTVVRPVSIETSEEVGQVARAFDTVNRQALRLASDQAALRHGYSESFVGVSRRSQALLERQLRLFEQLEQDEEDPDQLARLFQLDHLATRMRRNNENLMVLSGSDLARRFARPTELSDVLRAAVSEIEQYPRVVLQPPPNVRLLGHVASDLVRLTAELLDNAANFSSPDTSVTVSSYQAGDGSVTIDVLDEGIGMGHAELQEANTRLQTVSEDDLATSRRMGLFVAGRLAVRHGLTVELHGGSNVEGVRATVLIPTEHIVTPENTNNRMTPPVTGGKRNGSAHHDMPTSGMLGPMPSQEESSFGGPAGGSSLPQRGAAGDTGSSLPRREPSAGAGSSLPRREPSSQPSGMFDPAPSGRSDAPDSEEDRPTETLFTPLSVPSEQSASESEEPPFDWPFGTDAPEPPAQPEPQRPNLEEFSTQWFQPSNADAQYQAMAENGDDGRFWPGDESESEAELPSTSGSSWMTEQPVPESSTLDPLAQEQSPSLTSGGLPKRGGADENRAANEVGNGQHEQRSPEELSRRLAGMQGGLQFGSSNGEARQEPDSGAWNFATDDAWRQAEAAVSQDPTTYTDSGLPRRTPKAQLAPGSLNAATEQEPQQRYQRDPEQLRGRLSSFQSGVQRGRHRAPDEG